MKLDGGDISAELLRQAEHIQPGFEMVEKLLDFGHTKLGYCDGGPRFYCRKELLSVGQLQEHYLQVETYLSMSFFRTQ